MTLLFVLQVLSIVLLILTLREHRVESERRDKVLAERAQRMAALITDLERLRDDIQRREDA